MLLLYRYSRFLLVLLVGWNLDQTELCLGPKRRLGGEGLVQRNQRLLLGRRKGKNPTPTVHDLSEIIHLGRWFLNLLPPNTQAYLYNREYFFPSGGWFYKCSSISLEVLLIQVGAVSLQHVGSLHSAKRKGKAYPHLNSNNIPALQSSYLVVHSCQLNGTA